MNNLKTYYEVFKAKGDPEFESLDGSFICYLKNSADFKCWLASRAGEALREEFLKLRIFGKLAPFILKLKFRFKK